jgi:hypothetical protein
MKHAVVTGIVLFLGLLFLSFCAKEAPQQIEWASSLDEAVQLAAEQNRPLIAVFWSDG